MISVKFVAQDKVTKLKVESNIMFFPALDKITEGLIRVNMEKLQTSIPNSRVVALIVDEGESNDSLFV